MCTQMYWCFAELGSTFLDTIFENGIGLPQPFKQMLWDIFVRI